MEFQQTKCVCLIFGTNFTRTVELQNLASDMGPLYSLAMETVWVRCIQGCKLLLSNHCFCLYYCCINRFILWKTGIWMQMHS